MRDALIPPLRAAALTALLTGLVFMFLNPPSFGGLEGLIRISAGALAIIIVTATIVVWLSDYEQPESEFRELVDRSEALAAVPTAEGPLTAFDELVVEALDGLPDRVRLLLADTPVIISNLGREHHAYGHYIGGTMAYGGHPDRIVIYQDTLVRDFGHDPDLLEAQVTRTVRHEVAHHIGWNEEGVRSLGL